MDNLAWALWGLGGAAMYAASRLITAIFGENEISPRMKARAWAQFVVALAFGPIAAAALTGEVLHRMGVKTSGPAVALVIGLSANALWPLVVDEMGKGFKRLLAGWLVAMGQRMSGDDKP